jgi:hypothetical protein
LKQLGVSIPGSGSVTNVGGLIQGLGGLLGGSRDGAATNAPGSGGASTNRGGLIQGLGGLLGGNRPNTSTNTSTNMPPAATNSSPVGNLLNQLLGPPK